MSTLQLLTCAVVLSTCAILGMTDHLDAAAPASNKTEKDMSLEDYLRLVGVQTDTYFTVETVGQRDGAFALLRKVSSFDVSARTSDDIVRSIEKGVDGVKVMRSRSAGMVHHVYGPGTMNATTYWLDKKISLSFSGVLIDFFDPLQKACRNEVEFEHGGSLGSGIPQPDGRTTIVAEASKMIARDAITCCLPFSERDRILWTCATRSNKTQTAYLVFGHQAFERKQNGGGAQLPFDQGEKAFRDNPESSAIATAAAAYITKQMRATVPFQVRWAMLYLGKQKVSQEIPLLIKHLDYKYTTCTILEESHPAVRALALMGKASSSAALKEITKESKDLRLKLLCHLVLLVEGPDAGTKAIKAQIPEAATAKQRARIEETLGSLLKSPRHKATRDTKAKHKKGINRDK